MLVLQQTLLALLVISASTANGFRASSGFPHKEQVERRAALNATTTRPPLLASWIAQKRLGEKVERQITRAKANGLTHKAEVFENKQLEVQAEVGRLERALNREQRARVPSTKPPGGRTPVKQTHTVSSTSRSSATPTLTSTSITSPSTSRSTSSKGHTRSPVTTATTTTTTTTSSSSSSSSTLSSTSSATSTSSLSSTSSSTSSSATSTATSTSSSSKKGLGYNTASFTTAFGPGLGWAYNWADTADGALLSTTEYIPMLWGSDATGWATTAQAAIDAGATHLLGFNEPDLGSQSNLSPATAASLWKTNMEPFYGKAKLVSPAITNGGPPSGVTWMSEFLGNCTGCHIDAMAAHWYDSATNLGYFTGYFTSMYQEFGLPIWITEFAGSGSVAQQQSFLEYVIPWMESTVTFVERYAAFGDFAGTFVDSTGALTPLGETYANTT